jgi:hypothetical protein
MGTCTSVVKEELDVITRFEKLMDASLGDASIYNKSKETFKYMFDDLQITETEKAQIVSQNIMQMTTSITSAAMQQALEWAKEDRDGAAKVRLAEAQICKTLAEADKAEEEVKEITASICLKEAQATAGLASSIRDNGMHIGFGCNITGLEDEGTKFESLRKVSADTYAMLAKTYREYGEVHIHDEANIGDNGSFLKGYSGGIESRSNGYGWSNYGDGFTAGYSNIQAMVAERQRIGFEDNKRQHSANSSAQFVSQLLGSEDIIDLDTNTIQFYIDKWVTAIDDLNNASCPASC